MFCCKGSRDVASKQGGGRSKQQATSSEARTSYDDDVNSENNSAFRHMGRDSGIGGGGGGGGDPYLTHGNPIDPTANQRTRVDERMLRSTPDIGDLSRNYNEGVGRLELYEEKLLEHHERQKALEAKRRAREVSAMGGPTGALPSGGGGRLVQREQGTGAGLSPESVRLSGHSLQASSGPSASSTRGSSASGSLWSRVARSGKKQKNKFIKNILAPPQPSSPVRADGGGGGWRSGGAQASRYAEECSALSSSEHAGINSSVDSSNSEDVVRVRLDGESTEERRRTTGGDYYEPDGAHGAPLSAPKRLVSAYDKDPINEVEVIRLNEEFYTSQELRLWRRLQRGRAGDFFSDADNGNNSNGSSINMSCFVQQHRLSTSLSNGELVPYFRAPQNSSEDGELGDYHEQQDGGGGDDNDNGYATQMAGVEQRLRWNQEEEHAGNGNNNNDAVDGNGDVRMMPVLSRHQSLMRSYSSFHGNSGGNATGVEDAQQQQQQRRLSH